MSVHDSHRASIRDFQHSLAQGPDDLAFPQEGPALAERGLRESSCDGRAGILHAIKDHVRRGWVVQFMQWPRDHSERFSSALLRGDQVPAPNRVSTQDGPRMVQNMKNYWRGGIYVCRCQTRECGFQAQDAPWLVDSPAPRRIQGRFQQNAAVVHAELARIPYAGVVALYPAH